MAPTPPFYHALNQFCKYFGLEILLKTDDEDSQIWTFRVPNSAFHTREYLEWSHGNVREEALGHLRWAMDYIDGSYHGHIPEEARKNMDDTLAFLRTHDHCNPAIGYHSSPHKGCPLR